MNDIIASTPETIPSVEVQGLSNYLNEISAKASDLHLSIIPNVVKDCASVFMDYKKMKIDNEQFNKKCRIIDDCLRGQIRNQEMSINFNYLQEMQKIDAMKEIKLMEIEVQQETKISEIENRTKTTLEQINSIERVKMEEIKAEYEIRRRAQDIELYKFQANLKEESRKFDKIFEGASIEQADRHNHISELQKICSYIHKRLKKGKASTKEMEYYIRLMEMQTMLLRDGFGFTQILFTICTEVK